MTEAANTPQTSGVPRWVQIIIWVALLGLLALVAFFLQKAQKPMAQVGKPIPDISFQFYEGYQHDEHTTLTLADLKGKVVVLNVWASWCKPCEQEAPQLEQAWESYKDKGLVLIGVDYVDTPSGAMSYLKKFKITYPNAPDLQSAISSVLNRNMGVPETYFIDKTGVLRHVEIGPFTTVEDFQKIVDPLLAE